MNNYDTKTWVWEAQINALKSELEVQAAENRKLRAALHGICMFSNLDEDGKVMQDIARAALSGDKP